MSAPFNPNAASGSTDPGAGTGTDVYGLSPDQEKWTFYLGEKNNDAYKNAQDTQNLDRHLPAEDRPNRPPVQNSLTETALDLMKKYAAMGTSADPSTRQAFANFQQELLALGAYGSSGNSNLVRFGTWTDMDAQALVNVFRSYQQVAGHDGAGQPISFEEYVNQAAQQSAANGQAGGSGSTPAPARLTDPNALRLQAQQAAQQALGHGLSDDQLNAFVDAFHASETNYQTATGATATAPDASSDSLAFAEQANPQDFKNNQAAAYMSVILNQLLPTESKRLTMTPTTQI